MRPQKSAKSLIATACLALFACFTALSPAQAQSSAPEIPIEIMLSHKGGCKLFHPGGSYVTQAQLHNIAANCANGFFQGMVMYGVYWAVKADNEPLAEYYGVRTGLMRQGRFEGIRIHINAGGILLLVRQDRSVAFRALKDEPEYSLQSLLNAITSEASKMGGPFANVTAEQLTNIAKLWDRSRDGVVAAYVQDTSNPRLTLASSSNTQTRNAQDDPKVFGRGARGG